MNSTCPDKLELYGYLDGELPRSRRAELDLHVRRCAGCRDELRSSSNVQGFLFRRPDAKLGGDFEERFFSGLMDRMVTAEEAASFRSRLARRAWVAAAAAAIVVAAGAWAFFGERSASEAPVTAGELAATETAVESRRRRAAACDEVARIVDALAAGEIATSRGEMRALDARLAEVGLRLSGELLAYLRRGDDSRARGALRAMATHGSPSYVTSLAAFTHGDRDRGDAFRGAVLDAVEAIGTTEAARMIGREVRKGYPAREGIRRLVRMDTDAAWIEVENLVHDLRDDELADVTAAVATAADERATDLLFDLYISGRQTQELRSRLARRDGVVARAREVVWGHGAGIDGTRRAIRLLGILRDVGSVERIGRLIHRRELAESAVVALADIGDADCKRSLASHLELDPDARLSRRRRDFQTRLTGSIATFGNDGAHFYLAEAEHGTDTFDRHYVVAAGHCGTESTLPALRLLLRVDHLRSAATCAIGLIGHESTLPTLERLLRDRNADVRREAIRALQRLGHRPRSKTRGFVRRRTELSPLAPRDYDLARLRERLFPSEG